MSQLAAAPAARSSLPAELTEFVGRRQDRADVRRLLTEARLVTLTGLGGVGKTRLALRVAADLQRAMHDGVCFVPLAELSSPELIPEATATALGIHDRSSEFGTIRLTEYLRDRELLLVLDNCEHLIDDCAILADTLLRTCPGLHVLATSREPLRIAGEVIRPVTPLSIPDSATELTTLQDYEAVRLFVERVRQVAPGFELDGENRAAVLEICRHLEGIPLALELAATRLRATSPGELLTRLRDHWQLLDLGSRNAPERHRTMSACTEWSYAQCTPAEAGLWERLSVFAGRVEMDAIEHVASANGASVSPEATADLVQALVDKSILTVEVADGRTQFRMHEVLRQYGATRLASTGSVAETRRALLTFYIDLLGRADAEWMSPRQIGWMRRLRREDANFRTALEFAATEPGEAASGLELAARLRKYAIAYGAFTEVRYWLRRLLDLVPEPGLGRLRGVRAACGLAALQGDRQAAAALAAEARELADGLPPPATWLADQAAGWQLMFLGEHEACVQRLESALIALEDGGNARDIAETYTLLGMARAFAGDLSGAAAAHERSLAICEASGESWCRSFSLWHLGLVVWAGGDLVRAIELERQSLELQRLMDEGLGLALCLEACAWMHAADDPRRSATLLGAADRLWHVMATSLEVLPGLTPLRHGCETAVRASLGNDQFQSSYDAGLAMDEGTAIACALDEKPTSPTNTGAPTEGGATLLTKRERQVAELVATGLTNQEIAGKLVLSRRTVEGHVERALTKLGFSSRTQLALWVSEHPRS
ncbi:LuxR family transcriptional regulator [Nocardioides immobilis]|uniref:LuxR family transcriptional regulator n=1 Tax=Nocardioides immobilis TaxID=2049295 RepID=A0A417Y173_9ACTN|nr:LuxR C-terminal-related transcriptional regulator [Nocardioides immobilis]RHW26317.1 LuxR family transcriptional regulator [Nocardioides immobilis]